MRLLTLLCSTLVGICFANSLLFGLVQEENLLARWSFDEGNGSIVNDSVIGGSPLFMNLGKWGEEENGNALSKFSMDISEGTGFALLEANRKFQVTSSYSILLWFKTNGLPDDYAQILSKRESTNILISFRLSPGEPAWKHCIVPTDSRAVWLDRPSVFST